MLQLQNSYDKQRAPRFLGAVAKETPVARNSASLTDGLFAKLEERIRSGAMPPGSRFPTQLEISAAENVSRTVVREAVARLSAQGLTTSRQGSGVFVAATAQYRAFQVTRDEMSELTDVIKLLEMRLALETEMAALAAARRTTADIGAIRDALAQMEAVIDDPEAAARADSGFHLAIARATQNHYYERLIEFLGLRLVPPRNLYLRDQSEEAHRAYAAKVQGEHEAILDAIVRMDSTRAREAARHHMQESLSRHSQLSETTSLRPKVEDSGTSD
ncbi:FadR family transcriptional regulator [Sphingomonas glacialis]|uniref:FadR family transcriptional regulator n=1 Tax=Sphingomonas glacialis TaxID=658225 RepID=A0A502G336_9SPHN|nr:FadR/GntR family transcriptional regulator [Sphingomonas glacialis]TPG56174.1 FadR family transcriptional regulator [Sphingomonas glacialis]